VSSRIFSRSSAAPTAFAAQGFLRKAVFFLMAPQHFFSTAEAPRKYVPRTRPHFPPGGHATWLRIG
jgi:hypothetical protein